MTEDTKIGDPFARVPAHAEFLEQLADREAIRDCLYRYCRGIDRCDADLLRSTFWPDALDNHAVPNKPPLNAHYWIGKVIPLLDAMERTMHHIANVIMRINGELANVESYFWAVHQETRDGELQDVHAAGRYLDKFERRDGEWRVARRQVLIDWFRVGEQSSDWSTGIFGRPDEHGDRHGRDMSSQFFKN